MTTEVTLKELVIKPIRKNRFSGVSGHDKTGTFIEGAQMGPDGNYKTGLTSKEEREFEEALSLKKGELSKSNSTFWGKCLELKLANDKPTILTFDLSNPILNTPGSSGGTIPCSIILINI